MADATIVVPCFNEADRLDGALVLSLVDENPEVELLLVNDGSQDATHGRLVTLGDARPHRIKVLHLPQNRGKAEAVRQGLLLALEGTSSVVGYLDADFSTPVSEVTRLLVALRQKSAMVVIGSRVSRLGSEIDRSAIRHYMGRLFATAAALMLRISVYDTQCGAKLFRRSPALQAALGEPFLSRWAFDVELLGRLLIGTQSVPGVATDGFLEVPLDVWRGVPGSKLGVRAMSAVPYEMLRIGADLQRRRREASLPRR